METLGGCSPEEEALTQPGRPAQNGVQLGGEQVSSTLLSASGKRLPGRVLAESSM